MTKTKLFLLLLGISLGTAVTQAQEKEKEETVFLCKNAYVHAVQFDSTGTGHGKIINNDTKKITRALEGALIHHRKNKMIVMLNNTLLKRHYTLEQLFYSKASASQDSLLRKFYESAQMIVVGTLRNQEDVRLYTLEIEFTHVYSRVPEERHRFDIPKKYLGNPQGDYSPALDTLMAKEINQLFINYRNRVYQEKTIQITGRVDNTFGAKVNIRIPQLPDAVAATNELGLFQIELSSNEIAQGEPVNLIFYDSYREKEINLTAKYRQHLDGVIFLDFKDDVYLTIPVVVQDQQQRPAEVTLVQTLTPDRRIKNTFTSETGNYFVKINAQGLLENRFIKISITPEKSHKYEEKETRLFDTYLWLKALVQNHQTAAAPVKISLQKKMHQIENTNHLMLKILYQQPPAASHTPTDLPDKLGMQLSFHKSLYEAPQTLLLGGNLRYFHEIQWMDTYKAGSTSVESELYQRYQLQAELSVRYMVRSSIHQHWYAEATFGNQVYACQTLSNATATTVHHHLFFKQFRPGLGLQLGWSYKFIGIEAGYFYYRGGTPSIASNTYLVNPNETFVSDWSGIFSLGTFFYLHWD